MSDASETNEYVYISYPHDNSTLLSQMEDLLKEKGYGVKYDIGTGVGKKRSEHLKSMIDGSKACVCLLTESYAKAPSCMRELNAILDHLLDKRIVFVYAGDKESILSTFSLGMRALLEGMKGIEVRDEQGLRDNVAALGEMIEDGNIERLIVRFGSYNQWKKERKKSFFERWASATDEEEWEKSPIEWIVLDKENDGTLLLISRYALDRQQYNVEGKPITWEGCSLRKWLNNEFLTNAFSREEQDAIVVSHLAAERNPRFLEVDPGEDTDDKVFLLSLREAAMYFPSDEARQCIPTPYALANGAYVDDDQKTCWWWLRSPGRKSNCVADVYVDGVLHFFGHWVLGSDGAVRPSLRIHP